jgi:hypothetical protein
MYQADEVAEVMACRQFGRDWLCDKKTKTVAFVYGNNDDATARIIPFTIVLCVKESMFGLLILAVIGEIQ